MAHKLQDEDTQRRRAQLLALPPNTLLTAAEASVVTQLSVASLVARRGLGQWPRFCRLDGRVVRYRLGDLQAPEAAPTDRRRAGDGSLDPHINAA